MKIIPAMNKILDFIGVITSFCFASSPASVVEAFGLSSTKTAAALAVRLSRRIYRPEELLKRSNADLMFQKSARMTKSSLQESSSDENASSSPSSSSSSFLDAVVAKIGSTTSMVVAGTFFVVLCYKRDALMVSFFFGAISNAIFGKVLKKILKIERPDGAIADNDKSEGSNEVLVIPKIDQPSDNGMPSSHAMSLGFICTFISLLLPNTTIPLMAYAAISLIYRVRVRLHTVDQIAVGTILGTFDGAVWWHLCTKGFRGFNVVEFVSSSGMINESGQLYWYFLSVPLLVGAAVVGSVERRLGKYFKSNGSYGKSNGQKQD